MGLYRQHGQYVGLREFYFSGWQDGDLNYKFPLFNKLSKKKPRKADEEARDTMFDS